FSLGKAAPMPKHLLAAPYLENKAGFRDLPDWGRDFVGAGPFKIKEWVPGSNVLLVANDAYPPGRPHLDEIQVRFIPDPNTLAANLQAGAVELTMSRNLSVEQGFALKDKWPGSMELQIASWIQIFPQMLTPEPPVGNVQFRRALSYAVDRQSLVDNLMLGQGGVADHFIVPDDPEFQSVNRQMVTYPYDPRRAGQLIESLGYSKGSDGMFKEPSGQSLSVE